MFDHANCTHDKTKVARAACRRAHDTTTKTTGKTAGGRPRQPRLPSMIAPKLRPLVDEAKAKGLRIRVMTDAPDGVEQGFVITSPRKPNCQVIIEAFQAATKGREGRAAFYRVEDDRSRQLSSTRAKQEIDALATA